MNNTERDALGGGVVGTAAGTAIGAMTGKPLLGAAIGGLAGTAGGALIGNEADKDDQRRRDAFQAQQLANAQAQAQAQQQRMGIADIIRLSREGQNPQIIINQIRTTRSTFQLTVSDLEMLKNSGVSDAVIAEMQNSPPGPGQVVPSAAPTVVYDPSGYPVVVRPAPVVVVGGPPRYYYPRGYYYRGW